jgi:FMN phosphatase YigB (HAD superfamily)
VADNPAKDFRGARSVGMDTVRVRHADGLYAGLEASSPADAPDREVARIEDMEGILAPCSWCGLQPVRCS